MNESEKKNVLSVIEMYVLNEKCIPTYDRMVAYDPFIANLFKQSNITKHNSKDIIIDFYLWKLDSYAKETNSFPMREKMMKYTPVYKTIFGVFEWKFAPKFNDLMLYYLEHKINVRTKTKMKSKFLEEYYDNKELFQDFYILNMSRENLKSSKFHEVWKKFQEIVIEVENYVVWRMEWGKFGKFSSSTRDKFMTHVKSIFPLYDHIWVTIKSA